MYRTFNCGVGMMLFIAPNDINTLSNILNEYQISYKKIGVMRHRKLDESQVQFV